eukprot:12849285-Alexandrium_andersonii.AAC.1
MLPVPGKGSEVNSGGQLDELRTRSPGTSSSGWSFATCHLRNRIRMLLSGALLHALLELHPQRPTCALQSSTQ